MQQHQRRVSLQTIRAVWAEATRNPRASYREIAIVVGCAPTTVHQAINELERAGYVSRGLGYGGGWGGGSYSQRTLTVHVPLYAVQVSQ